MDAPEDYRFSNSLSIFIISLNAASEAKKVNEACWLPYLSIGDA